MGQVEIHLTSTIRHVYSAPIIPFEPKQRQVKATKYSHFDKNTIKIAIINEWKLHFSSLINKWLPLHEKNMALCPFLFLTCIDQWTLHKNQGMFMFMFMNFLSLSLPTLAPPHTICTWFYFIFDTKHDTSFSKPKGGFCSEKKNSKGF